jgi:uncharacterized protein (TIGR02117 family)
MRKIPSVLRGAGGFFAALIAAFGFWFWTGTRPPLGAPPARAGDCVQIKVWNNGYHTDLTFPAAILSPDHPLRRIDPAARYLLVGWGDEAFFRSNGDDLGLGVRALLPGGAVTMHLIAGGAPIESFYIPESVTPIALSHAGVAALARRLADTLVLDSGGRAQIIAPGHGGRRSWFLKARGEFDLFQVCNQWTARTLRLAGINLNAAFLYTGDMVVAALARAPHECPPAPVQSGAGSR